jgi:hypothetical protein
VMVGADTVFCNYCTLPDTTRFPRRTMRVVRFRSLDTALARVTNAANPKLQLSTDTAGRVTPLDTATAGVRIVMEVPGDSAAGGKWADTVLAKLSLRPLDTLRVRPDSNLFPTANGTGLSKQIYPNADTIQANVVAATTTNFIAGLDFLSRVQDPPTPGTGAAGTIRWIVARVVGGPEVFRPSLPSVTWESANRDYLQINAAGAITAQCAQIGGNCTAPATPSTWLLTCNSNSGAMPADFTGEGAYTVPNCTPTKTITPFPGALCTTTNSNDLSSICTIWVRATATDPATGKLLRRLYRINIRR